MFGFKYIVAFLLSVFISAIICDSNSNKADIASLSRDAFGRINPNELVAGYFPAWAVVLLIMSGIFMVVAVLGLIGYALGCRNPKKFQRLMH